MRESPLSSAQRPAKQAEPSKKFPSDLGHIPLSVEENLLGSAGG